MNFFKGTLSLITLCSICLGFFISFYSWDGVVYFFDKENIRLPADNTKNHNLKGIKSRIAGKSFQVNLSESSNLIYNSDNIVLNLKNIYLSKKKVSVCKLYNKIQLNFIALNVATSGEVPQINISALCKEDNSNSNFLHSIFFPMNEDQVSSYENQQVELSNMDGEWPLTFRLGKIIFLDDTDAESPLEIDLFDVKNPIDISL